MKISIITICFNSRDTIARAIESVVNQNYSDLEYIIIDGGSTDGTLDVIKRYESKITYIITEPDQGISDAFNKGVKLASGGIIGILNSDDWYEPKILDTVALQLNNKSLDFIVGSLRLWSENNHNFVLFPDKNYQKKIGYKMPRLNHPASFFKREVYDSVGLFNLKYKYAMDYDFFARVLSAGKKGVIINQILTNMSFSGVSDKYAVRAYREGFDIAVNKLFAGLYFIYSVIKYYLRKLITLVKLDNFLLYIRLLKYRK